MVVSIVADTRCALIPSVCDLKAAQMNVGRSMIRELLLWQYRGSWCTDTLYTASVCVEFESCANECAT